MEWFKKHTGISAALVGSILVYIFWGVVENYVLGKITQFFSWLGFKEGIMFPLILANLVPIALLVLAIFLAHYLGTRQASAPDKFHPVSYAKGILKGIEKYSGTEPAKPGLAEVMRKDERELKDAFKEAKAAARTARQAIEDKVNAKVTGEMIHRPPFFYNGWELDKPLCPRCYQLNNLNKYYLIHDSLPPEVYTCPVCGWKHFPNGNMAVVHEGY